MVVSAQKILRVKVLIKYLSKTLPNSFGFRISKTNVKVHPQHMLPLEPGHFFDMYFSLIKKEDFFLVQIGANDGKSRDMMNGYLEKYDLNAILVEPQKEVFERLKKNYADKDNVSFANVAIGTENRMLTLFCVKRELVNSDNYFETTAIASLDKETIKTTIKKRIPKIIKYVSDNIDDYIDEIKVECLTFESFMNKFKVPKVVFLFLDCEGYDYEILKTIDFSKYKPEIINFESKFLSDEDRKECENMLLVKGYKMFRHGNDTCAFLAK